LKIRVYQRARILLLKSEGASNKAIADKLDIGIGVVKRCLNKFKENGVEASLCNNKGRGRKAEITDDDITWVISKACQKPKDYGYSAEFWYPEFDAKMHDVLVIYKQIEMQFDKDGKLIPFPNIQRAISFGLFWIITLHIHPKKPRNI
jgi:transposase